MNKILVILALVFMVSCQQNTQQNKVSDTQTDVLGKLFIIGGGDRSPQLVKDMLDAAEMGEKDYVVILPMASAETDTSFYYAKQPLVDIGFMADKIFNFNFSVDNLNRAALVDSLANAKLIYICGGDQSRFMKVVAGNEIYEAIKIAYQKGALIAGTSAGAAVMSKIMITGDEYKHPEYTGDFKTIETENMVLAEGMGLIEGAIIDQHFIKRMRMNRLISVVLENAGNTGIGIDESTAILVRGNTAKVFGISQVIVIRNPGGTFKVHNGLLAAENLELDVYIEGDQFLIRK